jgi:hypothetical protein
MTAQTRGEDSEMKSTTTIGTAQWTTPVLAYKGTVGQILQGGGGKLSIAGKDPGEGRCEKPHEAECRAISGGA